MDVSTTNISLGKHILLLTPGFPKDESDDTCIPPLQEFIKAFTISYPQTKFNVISLHYPYKTEKYYWNGIPVIPLSAMDNKFKKPYLWLKAISEATKLNKEIKIDLIHSFWFGECAMLGNILSNKFNCEHICTMMGQDAINPNFYQKLFQYQKMKIVSTSKIQANEFTKRTNRNPDDIIHWGIEDQNFEIVNRDIDLLAVGSLIPLKNYSLLLNVLEEIKILKPDIKCILAGTGPEEAKLKSLVKEKGIESNISFAGLISRSEILNLMQKSKILIHPSIFEGFGYVFAEALVSGMNIVSYNVGSAQNHPKWFIANDEVDFITITKNLLSSELDFNSVNLFPLNETIEQYASIYGLE